MMDVPFLSATWARKIPPEVELLPFWKLKLIGMEIA
jgi:hypothetical protein